MLASVRLFVLPQLLKPTSSKAPLLALGMGQVFQLMARRRMCGQTPPPKFYWGRSIIRVSLVPQIQGKYIAYLSYARTGDPATRSSANSHCTNLGIFQQCNEAEENLLMPQGGLTLHGIGCLAHLVKLPKASRDF